MPERKPIRVAVSVLADISTGIYRTPANALNELVSNAFDANATRVVISTGFPNFRVMTCQDNGDGMSDSEFESIMDTIGGSNKRASRQFAERGRPLIGKIGIGMLAIAQICDRFTIISSTRDSATKFEAHVDFTGFATEEAQRIPLGSEKAKEIGGYVLYNDLPEDLSAHYTKVVLENIKPGFRERLLDEPESKILRFKFHEQDPKTMQDFVEWLIEEQKDVRIVLCYNRLLWNLGLICPVPYLEDGPVSRRVEKHDVIPHIRQALLDYDFTVEVDGLELRKPILLPTSPEFTVEKEDCEVYPIEFDDEVEDKRLAFTGYIYRQRKVIMPPELRGLLIRIRNVAIGTYDKAWLNFPAAQGPRMGMLSAEIHIEEGLEDALNVDRNSFRETDSHYIKLQEVIYKRLGGDEGTKVPGIFSDVSKYSKKRASKQREQDKIQAQEKIIADIKKLFGRSFEIERSQYKSLVPVTVDMDSSKITIYERHSIFPRAKGARRLLERILIAYELANGMAESKDEVREEFYRILTES